MLAVCLCCKTGDCQIKKKVTLVIEKKELSIYDTLKLTINNLDTNEYFYHLQVMRKRESKWISIIPEGQQSFFKIGFIESSRNKNIHISIFDLLKDIYESKNINYLKLSLFFTKKGIHPSKSNPVFLPPEYIYITQ